MIHRLSRFFDQRPLLAIWLGFAVCFVLMYCAAPLLVRHADAPAHVRGAT